MGRYRVIGRRQVLGFDPGTEFEADLDDVQEERLIVAGHLASLNQPRETWTPPFSEPEIEQVEEDELTERDEIARQGGHVEEQPS